MQSSPINFLKEKVEQKHIVHAYIFLGTNNLISQAKEFAMALNCLNLQKGGEPCGVCTNCYKIKTDSHPDTYFIKPDGNSVKIQQVREVQKNLSYKIYEGLYKVIIFEEADKLTLQAANSLLKTLEEPLPNTLFILLAEGQKGIPDTILSRCQKINFGKSLEIGDYVEAISFLEKLFTNDLEQIIPLIDKLEKEDKEQIKLKINSLMTVIRDLIVIRTTKEDKLLYSPDLNNTSLINLKIDHAQLVQLLERLYEGLKDLEININKRLFLDNLFLGILKST